MLKLRKNKKGFTLVELIVVIAIMAVLAGVVAGVTVSQLNKQTDKTNQSQAKTVADFISAKIVEEGYDFENDDSLEVFLQKGTGEGSAVTFTIVDTKGIGEALKDQYGGLISYNGNGDKGKTIGVSFDKANTCFYIVYLGKQGENKGNVKYKVSAEAVVTKVSEGQAIS